MLGLGWEPGGVGCLWLHKCYTGTVRSLLFYTQVRLYRANRRSASSYVSWDSIASRVRKQLQGKSLGACADTMQ